MHRIRCRLGELSLQRSLLDVRGPTSEGRKGPKGSGRKWVRGGDVEGVDIARPDLWPLVSCLVYTMPLLQHQARSGHNPVVQICTVCVCVYMQQTCSSCGVVCSRVVVAVPTVPRVADESTTGVHRPQSAGTRRRP